MPDDPLGVIEQVVSRTEDWLRRYDAGWDEDATWSGAGSIGDQADLAARLGAARLRLERLRVGSAELGQRLARLERSARRKGRNIM
jgi:hypothetical protein